ncbi:unnamed protein product [Mytilus edulis]|uniref:SGNH hydrolase-type esterase domain-containing protein n=1 Tax=Mytilus edulis TaxID=6550 RepID=A0A8S3S3P4_MYTED|nr:unnamed protein product [Mytilus edulis]
MIAPLHVRGHLVFYNFVLEAARRHFGISREKANSVNLRSFPIAEDDFKFGKECWELQTSFTRNREFGWYNLGFDGTEIQVEFASLGGGTLRPGPKCIQKENFMHIFHTFKPNTVFMQIGGNDLTQENYPDKLARDIVSFADNVITVYGVSHVVIGQLLPRYSGSSGHDYNEKVNKVNRWLDLSLKGRVNITFWHHRGLWNNTASLLIDQVHLNNAGMLIYAKNMPTQRSRVRRRVAPTDLRDADSVPVIPDIVAPQPRRRKRARADPPQVPADRPVQPVQQPAESIPQIPVAHPSADQIAAAMISQLKDSGVQLTVNREPVTTNFLTNCLTDGVSHDNTGRRDLHNAEPIQIAESGPNSSYVLAPPLVTDPDVLAYTGQDTVEGSSQALGIDNSAMGKTATYILQNTLPLGFNVDEKIRRDIWSDSYLDLIKLLPNFNEEENDDILFSTKSVEISKNANAKQLTNIHLWTAAFDIFMSIHHVKYPHLILSLIKYAYNIRVMSKQFGFLMARSYDEAFRRVRKVMRFDWSNVNDDLWRTAFYEHFNSSQTSNGNTNKTIHSQWGTAGPTADQENVPTSQLANSNTSVSDVPKTCNSFMQGRVFKL